MLHMASFLVFGSTLAHMFAISRTSHGAQHPDPMACMQLQMHSTWPSLLGTHMHASAHRTQLQARVHMQQQPHMYSRPSAIEKKQAIATWTWTWTHIRSQCTCTPSDCIHPTWSAASLGTYMHAHEVDIDIDIDREHVRQCATPQLLLFPHCNALSPHEQLLSHSHRLDCYQLISGLYR